MDNQPQASFQINSLTLRGIGPYLHGTRLDIKPLTILCGTNGSGKSTWIRVLRLLDKLKENGDPRYGFPEDVESFNYQYATNAILSDSACLDGFCPESEGDEETYGPYGTIGIHFTCNHDITLIGTEEETSDIDFAGYDDAIFTEFLQSGKCQKSSAFSLFLTHQHRVSDGEDYRRGFILKCDEAFRFEYRMQTTYPYEPGKPREERTEETAFLTRTTQSGEKSETVIPIDNTHGGEKQICDLMVERCEQLIEEITSGCFHLDAIRKIQNISSESGLDMDEEKKQRIIASRYVAENGEYTHFLRNEFILNPMYSTDSPVTGAVDNCCSQTDGDDQDHTFLFYEYDHFWTDKLLNIATAIDYDNQYSSQWKAASTAPSPKGYLCSFIPDRSRFEEISSATSYGIEDDDNCYNRYISKPFSGLQLPGSPPNMSAGFHQVYPLIIQAGLMKMNEVLTIENPEVHLHPDLQIRVIEFLLAQAALGKTIILETHSDLAIMQAVLSLLKKRIDKDDLQIYFTSLKPLADKYFVSNIEPIEINNHGQIENWPKGFMDASSRISEEILDIIYGGEE